MRYGTVKTVFFCILLLLSGHTLAEAKITTMYRPNCFPIISYTCYDLADAIYLAEGGNKTKYPYGILTRYKHTDARTACLNTIKHKIMLWLKTDQKEDFIIFLSKTYCPVGCNNDNGTNCFWVKNVKYFLWTSKVF